MESAIQVVSFGKTDFSASKREISKNLYMKIEWKSAKIPKSCNLESNHIKLLNEAESDLTKVLDNRTEAFDYAQLLMVIADKCVDYLEAQLFTFSRIEEILGIGIDCVDSDSTAYGIKNASLFNLPDGTVNYVPFTRALSNNDYNLQKSSAIGLATLFSVNNKGDMSGLVRWICNNLTAGNDKESVWMNAIPSLKLVVKDATGRNLFLSSNGLSIILSLLNKLGVDGNAQWIYELSFVLWALTLTSDKPTVFSHSGVVATLVQFLAHAPSRKVIRVIVAALANLASWSDSEIQSQILASNLEIILANIAGTSMVKQSTDPEFDADFSKLNESIARNARDLSTFDRWVTEVNSGALRWGVLHTEKFWKANYRFVDQNKFEMLGKLIELVNASDPVVVAVALSDIGEISRFYPNGRVIVSRMGGKDAAMAKLEQASNSDGEIEKYALQCVSKIMVENWENLK